MKNNARRELLMKPRLAKSKKWTSLPVEYLQQITQVFIEYFRPSLKGGQIKVQGRIYKEELCFQVSYLPSPKQINLKQANFEASIEYDRNKDNMIQLVNKAIDCTGVMVEKYFANPRKIEFPRSWQSTIFEQQEVFLQYSTINTHLENLADQILGHTEPSYLVKGQDEEEELTAIKIQLGLNVKNQEESKDKD